MIQPIVTLTISIAAMIALQFFSKRKGRFSFIKKQKKEDNEEIAQNLTNVKDIRKNFLYTKDNKIFVYIRVESIDIDLLSKKEQRSKTNILTKEISSLERENFKFIAISKPTDISFVIQEHQEILLNSTDYIQKEILRKEILSTSDYATSGESMERQFYIVLWEDYADGVENEILKIADDFMSAFISIGIKTEILKGKDVYQFANLINNPSCINEEIDINPSICILES